MRIDQLSLVRYGRFTDRVLAFPAAAQDIHLVLGPNEAGKSTVRRAVAELLYGIERQTPLGFLHPMSELRLDAVLSHGGQPLALQRLKKDKAPLRTADGAPLADAALLPLLGGSDKAFFERMFALDQQRLADGGLSLLSARDDLGRLLFQSAAGLAGLGDAAQALADQADALWGVRKRGDRLYHQAQADLEAADEALKTHTVRIKAWREAQATLQAAAAQVAAQRQVLATARSRQTVLERIRRVRPLLAELQRLQQALDTLGPVAALPADAARTLADAQAALASSRAEAQRHQASADAAQQALATLQPDAAVLAAADEIDALDEARIRCAPHPAQIQRLHERLARHWAQAQSLVAPLGWAPADAAALQRLLPPLAVRQTLQRLLQALPVLQQARQAAQAAWQARERDARLARQRLAALPPADDSPALAAALDQAQRLGDAASRHATLQAALADAQAASHQARLALAPWRGDDDALRALQLPPPEPLAQALEAARHDQAELRRLADAQARRAAEIDALALQAQQLADQHQPVDDGAVLQARGQRDSLWQGLRAAPGRLATEAPAFEQAVVQADQLADRRHATASAASDLRALQQRLAALRLAQSHDQQAQAALAAALAAAQAGQAAQMQALGLDGLPPPALARWAEARQQALDALAREGSARRALQQHADAVAAALQALDSALRADGLTPDVSGQNPPAGTGPAPASAPAATLADAGQMLHHLAVLRATAQALQQQRVETRGQRRSLALQTEADDQALQTLADEATAAQAALDDAQQRWQQALAEAGLAAGLSADSVAAQLAVMQQADSQLAAAQALRDDQLAALQAALDDAQQAAQRLAQRLAPAGQGAATALADAPALEPVALALRERLATARAQADEVQRLQRSRDEALAQAAAAQARGRAAAAAVQPLRQRAGLADRIDAAAQADDLADDPANPGAAAVDDPALAQAIERWTQHQALAQALQAARQALDQAGDGLDEATLRAEAASTTPEALAAELAALHEQAEQAAQALAEQAAAERDAERALAAIAGSDAAAQAEARRQDALARMAGAVDRHLRLATAARLLRWAIERFRQTQQGPLLAAASRWFALLTDGSFERLVVDFDHEPPALEGRRPAAAGAAAGTGVAIDGMSEGTRDQLFLALRLAALQLHLEAGHALPFIADDLLVNWDDARSRAGLLALGELSRQTQVIVLTHHQHVVDLARQALGPALNVITL